jgi:hypothetical protein
MYLANNKDPTLHSRLIVLQDIVQPLQYVIRTTLRIFMIFE